MVLEKVNFFIIVKEVGQGMGMESLWVFMQFFFVVIDFVVNGGINFVCLEMFWGDEVKVVIYE